MTTTSHARQPATKSPPPVGGMLIGYYVVCPRKAWLSMRGLWMEQESDVVAVGRLIDESSYGREKKGIMLRATTPDGMPLVGCLDWAGLSDGILHETKKSRAVEDAHRWQVRFYLWLLKLNGVTRSDGNPFEGMINYPRLRKTESVSLAPKHEKRLEEMVRSLTSIAQSAHPPPRIANRRFCGRCAFEEMCYG